MSHKTWLAPKPFQPEFKAFITRGRQFVDGHSTQFSANEDWVFASSVQVGRLPYSYTGVKQELQRAADAANLGHLRSHSFRHTYRTWLDSVGTSVGVQQKLMRHADIRTTINVYGDAASADMIEAHGKIVGLALNGTEGKLKY